MRQRADTGRDPDSLQPGCSLSCPECAEHAGAVSNDQPKRVIARCVQPAVAGASGTGRRDRSPEHHSDHEHRPGNHRCEHLRSGSDRDSRSARDRYSSGGCKLTDDQPAFCGRQRFADLGFGPGERWGVNGNSDTNCGRSVSSCHRNPSADAGSNSDASALIGAPGRTAPGADDIEGA